MYNELISNYLLNIESLRMYIESVEEVIEIKSEFVKDKDSFPMLLRYSLIKMSTPEELDIDSKGIRKNVIEFVEKEMIDNCEVDKNGRISIELNPEVNREKLFESMNIFNLQTKQHNILYSGTLMLLVVYFEEMFGKMILNDLIKYSRIKIKESKLTFEELEDFGSVDEAKKYLIEKEVNSIMKENCDYWFNEHLRKKVKLKLKAYDEVASQFNEIMARRNLLVHNDGIVNKYYLNRVVKNNIYSVKQGDVLKVGKEYIENAINIFEEVGLSILHELNLKERLEEKDLSDIFEFITYKFLFENRYKIALILYELLLDSQCLKGEMKKLCEMNYWQCHKWLDTSNEKIKNMENDDYSIYEPRFKLGGLALQERYDEFFEVFPSQNEISFKDLEEWPIFRDVRKDYRFKELINKINN